MYKQQTKKQMQQSAVGSLVAGLVFSLVAIGFFYLDWREQVKFYNFWERGINLDLKTGKPIPNYQPPPFEFRFDRAAFIPLIVISGAISLLFVFVAAHELRKSQKMVETREMLERDAELEAIANSPKAKRNARDSLILQFAPFVVLIPVPFIAMYGLGIYVFLVYIIFVAIFIGALYVILPRRK